jgi:hypothetical protein
MRNECQDKCDLALISETKGITIKVYHPEKIGFRQVSRIRVPKHWFFGVNKRQCDER